VPYSFEVIQDALGFQQELTKLLVDGADQLMATAYTTGTGSDQPTGIIKALDGGSSEVSPASAETFAAADVFSVLEAVPPRFRANASWQANLSVVNLIHQFETSNGARMFPELDNDRLLRRPLNENSNMDGSWDTGATADNFILLAGDFSNFVIVDRIGTTIELAPHLFGANGRPNGQRGLIMGFRTGSDSVNDSAFALLNLATTA
jgi:HK97 family phage major capsid protein